MPTETENGLARLLRDLRAEVPAEYIERNGKRYRMWRESDTDPRTAEHTFPNAMVTACDSCRKVGGLLA